VGRPAHQDVARYRPENPDLPTLDPWRNTTPPPAEQFVFERNPFSTASTRTACSCPMSTVSSLNRQLVVDHRRQDRRRRKSDLQATGYRLRRLHLPEGCREALSGRRSISGSGRRRLAVALMPNLNCADPVWRDLFRDVRSAARLSLAIDRHEINMVIFYGLGKESADTVLPESPLYSAGICRRMDEHDKAIRPTACSTRSA
jgi:peptide/nickel transport system substrate-binding protein